MSALRVEVSGESAVDEAQSQPKLVEVPQPSLDGINVDGEPVLSLRALRARVEVRAIKSALKRTGWNRKQAARLLKISYRGLLYKIQRHNIAPTVKDS